MFVLEQCDTGAMYSAYGLDEIRLYLLKQMRDNLDQWYDNPVWDHETILGYIKGDLDNILSSHPCIEDAWYVHEVQPLPDVTP